MMVSGRDATPQPYYEEVDGMLDFGTTWIVYALVGMVLVAFGPAVIRALLS